MEGVRVTTWLDTDAAATHLRKSAHEVRRNAFDQSGGKRCPKGSIPAYKNRGRWRFDLDQLDAYVRGEDVGRRPILSPRSKRTA